MQNDSFKMRQHYAPYNRSEESHRKTDKAYTTLTLVVGYFAYAQYDVKSPIVGYADTSPKEEAKIYFKSAVKLARSSSNALSACALSLPFTE